MRTVHILFAASALLFLVACGSSATAINSTPASPSPTIATKQPVISTPVVVVTPARTEVVSTPTSTEEAQLFAANIAKDATAFMIKEAGRRLSTTTGPNSKELWLEGTALRWQGELILWIEAHSVFTEEFTVKTTESVTGSSYALFMVQGLNEATRLAYERGANVPFTRVYLSYSFKDNLAESHYYYTRSVIDQAHGDTYQPIMFEMKMDTGKTGAVPWIAGAK